MLACREHGDGEEQLVVRDLSGGVVAEQHHVERHGDEQDEQEERHPPPELGAPRAAFAVEIEPQAFADVLDRRKLIAGSGRCAVQRDGEEEDEAGENALHGATYTRD